MPFFKIQYQATASEGKDRNRLQFHKKAFSEALTIGRSRLFDRSIEAAIIRPDGTRRDILQTVFPIPTQSGYRIGSVTSDITERKLAEVALRESEEQYRYIVENASDGFVIVLDGLILFANSKIAEILKLPPAKIIGMPFEKFIAPEEASVLKERYTRRIAGEDVPSVYETKAFTKEGKRIDIECCIDLIHYRGRLATFVMVRNITDRKRIQDALDQAQRSYHLASLGTLAAGISHEINQPLTALKVKVDGLLYWGVKKPAVLKKDILQHLRFVSDQADKIDQIIRHMRSLIRHEKPHASHVDVNETIRRACSFMHQQLASHGIELRLKMSGKSPRILSNATSLEQIVINLVQNALKALDRTIRTDKTVISRPVFRKNCIIVADNGTDSSGPC
jgi:PAS domain S-box-containing protein